MDEYTLVKTVPGLPKSWEWYPDANVVALHPSIDTPEKRSAVYAEVYAHWRRSCIRVVSDDTDPPGHGVQPMNIPAQTGFLAASLAP